MNSIRNKILLAIALVTLPPMLVLGWYGGDQVEKALREQGLQRLDTRINGLSAQMDKVLSGTDGDLLLLADAPSLSQYWLALDSGDAVLIEAAKKNLAQTFTRLLQIRGNYHQVAYLDATGMEKIRAQRGAGDSIMITPETRLENNASRALYTEANKLQRSKVHVTPIELNRVSGKLEEPHRPVIHYSTPVFDASSRKRGVLEITVNARPMLELVAAAPEQGETLLLVDASGAYLSHPDKDKEWGGTNDLGTAHNLATDYPRLSAAVLSAKGPLHDESAEMITIARPIPVPGVPDRQLGVLVDMMPSNVLYASARRLRNNFWILTGGALAFALIVGAAVAYYITRPISALTVAVDRMSRGELEEPIRVTSGDEMQKLAEAMERLRKSMKLMLDKFED
ncbi:MAG TPA: cache domain-containing protein [Candidatus Limnocylindrales bacterium]|nr:cache domain-containing protein [Candidatus Limnocylindrales bacterium]